jgi:hypothetical protein
MIDSSTVLGGRDGNRKADADRAAGLRIDRRIDAEQVAVGVDQRAARVAEVDRGIGLDEVLEMVDVQVVAPQAEMMPMVTVWPTPNGLPIASTTSPTRAWSGMAQHHHRQVASPMRITARSVSGSVPTTLAGRLAAVGQADFDLVGAFHHVVVGQDVAVRLTITPEPRLFWSSSSSSSGSPKKRLK